MKKFGPLFAGIGLFFVIVGSHELLLLTFGVILMVLGFVLTYKKKDK